MSDTDRIVVSYDDPTARNLQLDVTGNAWYASRVIEEGFADGAKLHLEAALRQVNQLLDRLKELGER